MIHPCPRQGATCFPDPLICVLIVWVREAGCRLLLQEGNLRRRDKPGVRQQRQTGALGQLAQVSEPCAQLSNQPKQLFNFSSLASSSLNISPSLSASISTVEGKRCGFVKGGNISTIPHHPNIRFCRYHYQTLRTLKDAKSIHERLLAAFDASSFLKHIFLGFQDRSLPWFSYCLSTHSILVF